MRQKGGGISAKAYKSCKWKQFGPVKYTLNQLTRSRNMKTSQSLVLNLLQKFCFSVGVFFLFFSVNKQETCFLLQRCNSIILFERVVQTFLNLPFLFVNKYIKFTQLLQLPLPTYFIHFRTLAPLNPFNKFNFVSQQISGPTWWQINLKFCINIEMSTPKKTQKC